MLLSLALAAIGVAAVHALAPDHWLPFAVLARARGWSRARTARMTLLCGLGHVTISVLLGLVGIFVGLNLVEAIGFKLESLATLMLIAFGAVYGVWGLRKAIGVKLHGHVHHHYDHIHDPAGTSEWTLFLLFSADPCVAVLPLMFAAASLGAFATVSVVVLYEISTLTTMLLLVLPAREGVRLFQGGWVDRYGHAAAGAIIAIAGIVLHVLDF